MYPCGCRAVSMKSFRSSRGFLSHEMGVSLLSDLSRCGGVAQVRPALVEPAVLEVDARAPDEVVAAEGVVVEDLHREHGRPRDLGLELELLRKSHSMQSSKCWSCWFTTPFELHHGTGRTSWRPVEVQVLGGKLQRLKDVRAHCDRGREEHLLQVEQGRSFNDSGTRSCP